MSCATTLPYAAEPPPEAVRGLAWLGLGVLPLLGAEHAWLDPAHAADYAAYTVLPLAGCALCVAFARQRPRVARAGAWLTAGFFVAVSLLFLASLLSVGHYPLYAQQRPFTPEGRAVGLVWNLVYLSVAAAALALLARRRSPPDAGGLRAAVATHGAAVLGYCRARCGAEADDLAQEVFLVAARRWRSFRGDSGPRTWLLGSARNVVRTRWRRLAAARRARRRLEADPPRPAAPPDPEAALVRREEVRRLLAAVERLPEGQRDALRLRFGEGLAGAEIAARLGTSEGAVRVRIHRALKRLRADLAE